MTIQPNQVRALVSLLREWGYDVSKKDEEDLVAEYDTLPDLQENKIGKFSKKSMQSRKAALRIKPRSGTQRRRIYDHIKAFGERGTYRGQIAAALALSENSVRPRVLELIEGGWVKPSGETTTNIRGEEVELLVAVR